MAGLLAPGDASSARQFLRGVREGDELVLITRRMREVGDP